MTDDGATTPSSASTADRRGDDPAAAAEDPVLVAEDPVLVADHGAVRVLTFNRPTKRNAFNQALWYGVADALRAAAEDDAVSCVVLTGAGESFTAGQDLGEMADTSVFESGEPGYRVLMPVVETFPKPLLAAVNGVGVGIGLTILPHCDLVYIAAEARLKAPFASLGVTTEASASLLLPITLGWQRAAELLFTEPWVDGARAVELGLALEVHPRDALLPRVLEVAATIAGFPLPSLMATKRLMLAGRGDAVAAARAREEKEFETLVGAMANQAALTSFLDR